MDIIIALMPTAALALAILYFRSYVSEKGRSLATREDVADLTSRIESVKSTFQAAAAIADRQRQTRYEACLRALTVVDAEFARTLRNSGTPAIASPPNTREAREVHNLLVLTCARPELIETFLDIMFGPRPGSSPTNAFVLLLAFRNHVRTELGFGESLPLSVDRAWIAKLDGDPECAKL